jgi:glyoxylase-like metal-dependent hydrolase (beta-lactamase superfamily II)
MKIDRFILGDFETNCYVVRVDESAAECLVIDPGFDAQQVVAFLGDRSLNPVAAILTHGHADHIVGLDVLRRQFPQMKVCIHKGDAGMLMDAAANLSAFVEKAYTAEPADVLLENGDTIEDAGIRLEVLHTPGHTPGGICLYARQEGLAFVGDTLFADSVGRADFPGGDMGELIRGIKSKLLTLPDNTVVYPGHGMRSTIGREKRANPFLI